MPTSADSGLSTASAFPWVEPYTTKQDSAVLDVDPGDDEEGDEEEADEEDCPFVSSPEVAEAAPATPVVSGGGPDDPAGVAAEDKGDDGKMDPASLLYPIFLPIDRNYESKYLAHYRSLRAKKGKGWKERCYLFLEHPVGWTCLIYHSTV